MTQKLSAWNYIKNNKRRVLVLIVSLSLYFAASYITRFMLGTAEVSFQKVFIDNYSKMQYVGLTGSSFGIDVEIVMEHMGAKLVEGRLPEKPGEVVIDEASVKNNHYRVGGYFREDDYNKDFIVSGIVSCDCYFGAGLAGEGYEPVFICVLSDSSIQDMAEILERKMD